MKIAHLCLALLLCCSISQAQMLYTVLWNFGTVHGDGTNPNAGFVYRNGYLYGTTYGGGAHCNPGCGTVFAAHLDHGLAVENVIYSFCNTGNPSTCIDGAYPIAGLVADQNGNLYGTTQAGGTSTCDTQYVTCGNVFELSYNGQAWNLTVLYSFRRVARISTLPEG